MRFFKGFGALLCAVSLSPTGALAADDWVSKSNEHAKVVLEVLAKYSPEGAASLGVDGLDEQIFDLRPNVYERSMADTRAGLRPSPAGRT